jgi:hypothetical protein
MITEQKLRQIRAKVELLESQLDAMIGLETQGLWAVGELELDLEARARATECEHILTELIEFVNMTTASRLYKEYHDKV